MEHLKHTETEEKIEEAAEDLELKLPEGLPVPLKIIVLVVMIGGLSVLASTFSGVFSFADIGFDIYLIRLLAGVMLVVSAYGMVKRKMWSLWVFAVFTVIALFFNPLFTILPSLILGYLIYIRKIFK